MLNEIKRLIGMYVSKRIIKSSLCFRQSLNIEKYPTSTLFIQTELAVKGLKCHQAGIFFNSSCQI